MHVTYRSKSEKENISINMCYTLYTSVKHKLKGIATKKDEIFGVFLEEVFQAKQNFLIICANVPK